MELLVPVELTREGPQAAWGFRLRGGTDVDGGTPLEIIRVGIIRKFSREKQQYIAYWRSLRGEPARDCSRLETEFSASTIPTPSPSHTSRLNICSSELAPKEYFKKILQKNKILDISEAAEPL